MASTAPADPADGNTTANAHRRRIQTTVGTEVNSGSLYDTGCFETREGGSWGFCGDLSCKDTYVTTTGPTTIDGVAGSYAATNDKNPNNAGAAGTQYTSSTAQAYLPRTATADNTDWSPRGSCSATCTQRSTGVCSASFLASVIAGVRTLRRDRKTCLRSIASI